jgi:hypothetical protein
MGRVGASAGSASKMVFAHVVNHFEKRKKRRREIQAHSRGPLATADCAYGAQCAQRIVVIARSRYDARPARRSDHGDAEADRGAPPPARAGG